MLTDSQEHFWGIELSKEKPTYTWTFKEEDEDEDYMIHTLFLKNAILGASALKGERNIIAVETQNFDKKDVKQPLLSLTLGQLDMCNLDLSFGHEIPVTFRLMEGNGPVALGGQQLVEFPPEEMNSQDTSALEDTMESELSEEDTKLSKKRKAKGAGDKKKGKMDESASDEDSMEEEDEDLDEEDDEEDESMEDDEVSSPEAGEKKKKKAKTQAGKKAGKTKISPKKAAKKQTKKGRK